MAREPSIYAVRDLPDLEAQLRGRRITNIQALADMQSKANVYRLICDNGDVVEYVCDYEEIADEAVWRQFVRIVTFRWNGRNVGGVEQWLKTAVVQGLGYLDYKEPTPATARAEFAKFVGDQDEKLKRIRDEETRRMVEFETLYPVKAQAKKSAARIEAESVRRELMEGQMRAQAQKIEEIARRKALEQVQEAQAQAEQYKIYDFEFVTKEPPWKTYNPTLDRTTKPEFPGKASPEPLPNGERQFRFNDD